ncbi:MAG: N-acetyl sugar amidotransferase [Actinomycetes bacterium]
MNPLRQVCARCLYDASTPGITFDTAGVCNYCAMHDQMVAQYPTGPRGEAILRQMAAEIRASGRGKKFDCVVGVSGGCDSSFLLHRMVELGLRPLAVHFDNTWNSGVATQNIYNVLEALGVELFTLVVNNREYDDLYRAFMLSGVKDIETPTDIGLTSTLYMAAEKYDVKYIIEGHSFRTEGVAPLGWIYMDGKLIESVHKQFGTRPMKTFPNLTMARFLRWSAVRGIKRLRPLYYMDYDKEAAKRFLASELNWTWYGGHHLENRFTAFFHTYWLPKRYGIDARLLGHAALVRSGQLDRASAIAELATPHEHDPEILGLVKKRLGFDDAAFDAIMASPLRHYSDYRTYKKSFERMRPLFWLLYKLNRVPKSFYIKFTHPDPSTPAKHSVPVQRQVATALPPRID